MMPEFQQVHIIHDPSNEERSKWLLETVKEQRMNTVIWPFVHGNIAEAHKQIVLHAIERNLDEVIIGEDDMFFYAKDGFQYFLKNKPADFDLYLSGVYHSVPELPTRDNVIMRFAGLHLYIVAKRFYRAFISAHTGVLNSIDNALGMLACQGMGKIVVCYPYAAVQREDAPSTNPLLYGQIYKHKYYFNSKNCYGYQEIQNVPK